MIKKALIGLGALVLLVIGIGVFTPKTYSIEERIVIDAPPEAVHAFVGELKRWPDWSPWVEQDPTIVTTFGDTTTGVGASQSWTSKDGDGELTFTMCDPDEGIAYDMAFVMEDTRAPASSAMRYRAVDGGTEVTWSMEGSWKGIVPPVLDGWMKLMSPAMIGSSFEKGLTNLKQVVESAPPPAPEPVIEQAEEPAEGDA